MTVVEQDTAWLIDGHADRGALLGAEVWDALHFADFSTGRTIFVEGDPVERVYVIASGMVKITVSVPHSRHVLRAVLGPGDIIDEAAVFGTDPHGVTATCLGLVRTGWLDTRSVHRMLEQRPRLALEWLQALAREIRLRDEDIVLTTSLDASTRVARQLLVMAQRFGSHDDGGLAVSHGLTRQEFAELVGVTKESVSRALATFAERGWVVTRRGGFQITDLEKLRAHCDA